VTELQQPEGTPPTGEAPATGPVRPAAVRTGDQRVDEAIVSLAVLDGRPVAEHPAVYEAVHAVLRDALADAGSDAAAPS
jgi:hypothetical protein